MINRTTFVLACVAGLPLGAMAANFPEIEPNDTKAQATANGTFTLAPNDTITGNSISVATTGIDTFRIRTPAASQAIYRHRLTITSATVGHTGSIRGFSAAASGVNTLTDIAVQTSSSTTIPGRMLQWYGFGQQEELFIRVTGAAATTSDYVVTKDAALTITPVAISDSIAAGSITIRPNLATQNAYDTDVWLYNSNFNPIAGYDDPDSLGITTNLADGVYYFAMGDFNACNNLQVTSGTFTSGNVLDFAGSMVGADSSPNSATPMAIEVVHSGGTSTATGIALQGGSTPWQIVWFTFTVGTGPSACPACPADFDQDGGVTGSDIGAFFAEFERGGACGDTDLDGGITGGDIAAFFAAFEAGGC